MLENQVVPTNDIERRKALMADGWKANGTGAWYSDDLMCSVVTYQKVVDEPLSGAPIDIPESDAPAVIQHLNDRGYCSELGGPRAARFDSGKPSVSEVPSELVLGAAEVFAFGREKYERFNWMKGFPYLQPYESAMRHMLAFRSGEDLDPDSKLHHLKHAACNLAMLLYFIANHPELDDRPVRVVDGVHTEPFRELPPKKT